MVWASGFTLFQLQEGEGMTKHILAISIVLLSLATHISAQNRGPKEALEGLQPIGLVVKYGNADGLDVATHSTTLQTLQDRANNRLRQAGIPLLQQTEDAGMVRRPRLVFTVTLNKHTETAPTIQVESRLYERVRLWRDAAKEMDLATWVQGGVGYAPKVTQEMLLEVFDGQLDEFINAYRAANPNPMSVESSTPNPPVQTRESSNSLQGLNGIRLFLSLRPDQLADAHHIADLQKMLQKEAEAKLVQAGIPVLKTEPAGRPLLYLFITLSRPNVRTQAPPIVVESDFWQRVRPIRDIGKEIYAVTWESHRAGSFAKSDDGAPVITEEAILKVLTSQLDEFIKAYNTANPKLSSVLNAKAH
jgi:hypothetical protein